MSKEDEEILRAILEKGSDKAKKTAADALTQQPPMPNDHPEVKVEKVKKRRKGLKKAIAAKIGNSKYYHDPVTGAIVDELGQPAPKKIAEQLVKDKVAPTATAPKATPRKEQSIPELTKLKKELAGIGELTTKSIESSGQMISGASVAFEQFQNVLTNFSTQNSQMLDAMVQQNADFHEKVIESITGVKAPTRSSGETKTSSAPAASSAPKKSSGSKGGGSRASKKSAGGSKYQKRVGAMTPTQKKSHTERVQARAEHIGAIRTKKNVGTIAKAGAVGAVGGAVAGGVIGALAGVQTQTAGPSVAELNARKLGPQGGNLTTQQAQTRVEQEKAQPPAGTTPSGTPQQTSSAPAGGGGAASGGIEAVARDMLARHEGRRNAPYKDSKGLWTVGIGHLIGDGRSLPPEMNRTFSDDEVNQLFSKDYAHHAAAAANIPGYDKINDMGKVALIDLTFNMGPAWYKKWPSFCKAMGEGNWQLASQCLQQSAWYGQVGRRAPEIVGLVRDGGSGGGTIGAPTGGAAATAGGAPAGTGGGVITPTEGTTERLDPAKMAALNAAKAASQAQKAKDAGSLGTTAVQGAAAANQAAGGGTPAGGGAPEANQAAGGGTPAGGGAPEANQAAGGGTPAAPAAPASGGTPEAGAPQASGEKPANVTFEAGKVDTSKVDPKLLKGFYQAAAEFGKPVRINSAYRGDEYQAQLWVRANKFHEPGIHIPARPSKTTTINYKGQTFTVEGSGKGGSAHSRGQAMDVTPGYGSYFERILNKYGVGFILGAKDPPHVQLMGGSNFTPPGGGEAPAGSPNATAAPAPTTAVQGAQMANASADRAIAQGSAPSGVQMVVMNNTRTINTTRVMHQAGSSLPQFNRGGGFNPLQMVAGALIGKAVSRLF